MNEQLTREIKFEIGNATPNTDDYLAVRNNLCHPSASSNMVAGEEELSGVLLKTPIECGSHAYIYNGHAVLGAVSDDGRVFISGEGLKTPGRARAVNEVLHIEGHFLDSATWIYTAGEESSYVPEDGLLVSESGIESDEASEKVVRENSDNRQKYYIEYIMDMILEFDGIPDHALSQCMDNGYVVRELGHQYGGIDGTINSLLVSEDLIVDALSLRAIDRNSKIAGRMIWDMKQDMQNILRAVQGLPTQFKS